MNHPPIDPRLGRLVYFVDLEAVVHPAIITGVFYADQAELDWHNKNVGQSQEAYVQATKDFPKPVPVPGAPPPEKFLFARLTVFLEAAESHQLSVPFSDLKDDQPFRLRSFFDYLPTDNSAESRLSAPPKDTTAIPGLSTAFPAHVHKFSGAGQMNEFRVVNNEAEKSAALADGWSEKPIHTAPGPGAPLTPGPNVPIPAGQPVQTPEALAARRAAAAHA